MQGRILLQNGSHIDRTKEFCCICLYFLEEFEGKIDICVIVSIVKSQCKDLFLVENVALTQNKIVVKVSFCAQ